MNGLCRQLKQLCGTALLLHAFFSCPLLLLPPEPTLHVRACCKTIVAIASIARLARFHAGAVLCAMLLQVSAVLGWQAQLQACRVQMFLTWQL